MLWSQIIVQHKTLTGQSSIKRSVTLCTELCGKRDKELILVEDFCQIAYQYFFNASFAFPLSVHAQFSESWHLNRFQ